MSDQNGDDKSKGVEGDKPKEPTTDQLVKATRYIFSEMQKIGQSVKEMSDWRQEVANKLAPPKDDGGRKDDDKPDLETMSNSELAEYLIKELSERVLKPVDARINDVAQQFQRTKGQAEIKEVSERYPDFWEFKDEIEARVKSVPGLSLDDAYTLARKDNATKAKELDDKREEERKAREAEENPETVFGGLLPTSMPVAPNQKMQPKEASEAAWEEHMTKFGLH